MRVRLPLLLLLGSTLLFLGIELATWAQQGELAAIVHQFTRLFAPLVSAPMLAGHYLIAPTVILFISTWLITRIFSPQPQTWSRRIVVALMLILIVRYLIWRTFTLNLDDVLSSTLSLGLFAAELLGLASSSIQLFLLFKVRDRRHQADQLALDVAAGHYQPSIDVLIPTYDEPAFILRRTVIGAQAMDYPNYQIHLLDDTRRPEIQALAAELGCAYITRPDNRHAKAGNLNHAIAQTQGELITCFDADFIPTRNFLQRTVGFFQDPEIALVQTPQSFYNPDPIARNLGLENILTPEEEVFYRQIQPMRDAAGSVVCAGTSFVLRRSAIEATGGFVTDSLSEDYFTAINLAAQGYRVVYLNEKLSAGLAAENIAAHAVQRLRWARGTLQAFFIKTNPLTIPGLTWIQRLGHFEGILHWFTTFSRAYFLLMPLAYAFWGIVPIKTNGAELLYFFIPFYLTQLTVFAWLNGRSRSAFLSDIYSLVLLFPLLVTVFQALLQPFSKGFQVTPKGTSSNQFIFNWHLAWPLILLFTLNAYSLWHTLGMCLYQANIQNVDAAITHVQGLDLGWIWSAYNLAMIGIALMILVDVPRPDPHEYFALRRVAKLTLNHQIYWGTTSMISELGCRIHLTQGEFPPISAQLPLPLRLEIPEANLDIDAIAIAQCGETQPPTIQLQFMPLALTQHRRLIELLFCRPGQWQHHNSPGEFKSLWLLLNVLFRPQILVRQRRRKAIAVGQV
ncbi:glycosyltransferase [Romeriopsis navalis]|uniref:glycosyltransferase n=1 Tax=Romeriopsis navalis TaxID=2992132 RepID=UPI0021F8D417|nr:glycosyltransferase [Romeriopsis navalis]